MLFTWSILLAFKAGKVSLILRTLDVEVGVLEAWAYDLVFWGLGDPISLFFLTFSGFLVWKYFEMTFISFLDLAGRGGRGRALLIVTGVAFGAFFLELPLEGGMRGVNFDDILDLSEMVL